MCEILVVLNEPTLISVKYSARRASCSVVFKLSSLIVVGHRYANLCELTQMTEDCYLFVNYSQFFCQIVIFVQASNECVKDVS